MQVEKTVVLNASRKDLMQKDNDKFKSQKAPKTRTVRMTVPLTDTCPPVSFTSWSKANLSAISREFLKPREDPPMFW